MSCATTAQSPLCAIPHPGSVCSIPGKLRALLLGAARALSSPVPSADCRPTRFGPDCRLPCQCAPGDSYCNAQNGQCLCLNGRTGPTCREGERREGTRVGNPWAGHEGRLCWCSWCGSCPWGWVWEQ